MDPARIKKLSEHEIDRAMEAAGVKTPRVMRSVILSKATTVVDHERDEISVEVTDRGKVYQLANFIESLRFDADFANCFELRPHPRTQERPYEVKAAEGLQHGDLESIASGKAVLTGWKRETTEVVAL